MARGGNPVAGIPWKPCVWGLSWSKDSVEGKDGDSIGERRVDDGALMMDAETEERVEEKLDCWLEEGKCLYAGAEEEISQREEGRHGELGLHGRARCRALRCCQLLIDSLTIVSARGGSLTLRGSQGTTSLPDSNCPAKRLWREKKTGSESGKSPHCA